MQLWGPLFGYNVVVMTNLKEALFNYFSWGQIGPLFWDFPACHASRGMTGAFCVVSFSKRFGNDWRSYSDNRLSGSGYPLLAVYAMACHFQKEMTEFKDRNSTDPLRNICWGRSRTDILTNMPIKREASRMWTLTHRRSSMMKNANICFVAKESRWEWGLWSLFSFVGVYFGLFN